MLCSTPLVSFGAADVTLAVATPGVRLIAADKRTLMISSEYFAAALSGRYAESTSQLIVFRDETIDLEVLITLLALAHCEGSSDISWDNIYDLLIMADRLLFSQLRLRLDKWLTHQLAADGVLEALESTARELLDMLLHMRCTRTLFLMPALIAKQPNAAYWRTVVAEIESESPRARLLKRNVLRMK